MIPNQHPPLRQPPPRRIFVCSPYRAVGSRSIDHNVDLAWRLCEAVLHSGNAPFAPHLFFPEFLDDSVTEQRDAGVQAGLAWLNSAEEVWVCSRFGITGGMRAEINAASERGIRIVMDPMEFEGVLV